MQIDQKVKERLWAVAVGSLIGWIIFALFLFVLSVSANAQSFVGGGFEIGGNRANTKDNSVVGGQFFPSGARIDKYGFYGGYVEGQYDFPLGKYAALSPRGLAEATTDPKNLGVSEDGWRYHLRPEVELSVRAFRQFAFVGQGGVGFTHIRNSQYNKSGLSPHAGVGFDFDRKYRFTFARIFKDTSGYNDNETEGYRGRFDALVPFSPKWGARIGLEYTRFNNIIPGVLDARSPHPCGCLRTQGNAVTFRAGLARTFKGGY
jgi:hypothetical protein